MLRQPRPLIPFAFEQRAFQTDLFRDSFGAGSLGAPRTSDIGYLLVTDTNGVMSVDSAELLANGTPAANDGIILANVSGAPIALARNAGRVFRFKTKTRTTVGTSTLVGFSGSTLGAAQVDIGGDYTAADSFRARDKGNAQRTFVIGSGDHLIACVQRATGGRVIAYDASANAHKLVFVYPTGTADVGFKLRFGGSAVNFRMDDLRVFDYPDLADDWIDASVHVTPSVSGTTYTAQADGHYHLAFTLPGSPGAGLVAVELRYRIQDASNYWTCYLKRNAGNTAWDLLVDSVSAGTPTNRSTVTGVGTPTRLIVIAEGNSQIRATHDGTISTTRGSTVTNSSFQSEDEIAAVWDASTTIGSLDSWALTHSLYDGLFA